MLVDETLAAVARSTGLEVDVLFFVAYLLAMALLWAGLVLVGVRLYRTPWLLVALGAAWTLRHSVPQTSANSFEPYLHPRMIAFSLGLLAIAAVLRRRAWLAVGLVAAAAAVHITTALWFGILVATALSVLGRRLGKVMLVAGGAAIAIAAWAVVAGPLQQSLTTMDEVWLRAVASKDSLFATEWPVWAWAANLGLLAVLCWAVQRRRVRGEASDADVAVAWGAAALVVVFLVSLPLVALRLALPVQLQISRVFWIVDLLATMYVVALFDRQRVSRVLACLLVAVSLGRAVYVMLVEHPERALFQIHLADSPWHDAMRWVAAQPADVHVLADPGHAWKYGTSVRVAGGRDVFLEDVKDSALAIYAREVAARVVERAPAVADFPALTPEQAVSLAARYDLDVLVTEADLLLPLAYRNAQFRIYNLER